MNSIKVDCKDLVRKKICILIVVQSLSRVQLGVTLWTVAYHTSLSMGFSRQEYWNGLPRPPPGDLPGPGIEPVSVMSPALAGGFFTTSATWDYLTIFASILWWMAICVSHSTMGSLRIESTSCCQLWS